jgi:hypothetical protein
MGGTRQGMAVFGGGERFLLIYAGLPDFFNFYIDKSISRTDGRLLPAIRLQIQKHEL